MIKKAILFLILIFSIEAKLPTIPPENVPKKIEEILLAHASYRILTPLLMQRTLTNYIEEFDPSKTYLIKSEVEQWTNLSEDDLESIIEQYELGNFQIFEAIYDTMRLAINRRHQLERQINIEELPSHVNPEEFKDMDWACDDQELLSRLIRIKGLQLETSSKLRGEQKEKAMRRIEKYQEKYEEYFLTDDELNKTSFIISTFLKSMAASLDAHTAYFTPGEATQFMMNVQQKLFGIGAQLRDDLNGFSIVKIIEGGPAERSRHIQIDDRIVAVDDEPVVGMDILSCVELIRGPEHTSVNLTLIRDDETFDITLIRGEVILKETRYEVAKEPFGDGVIGYLRLYSFYQDAKSSSAMDLAREIREMQKECDLKGIILDLRYNAGGMLSQAVDVTGLFITKGIVVGVKDNSGKVRFLRDFDGQMTWDGPLIVLVNKASASASEIVAQTLQDYGRAIIVGDEHTYGKGSFQTFTLQPNQSGDVNPEGEFKVTRGRYYTVSGKTPQLTGVASDIIVPGLLSHMEIGEKYAKYPLDNDSIKPNFDDDLSDIPFPERLKIRMLYKFNLQPRLKTYTSLIDILKKNTDLRIEKNPDYKVFLDKAQSKTISETSDSQNDFQLLETYNIMKDLIELSHKKAA